MLQQNQFYSIGLSSVTAARTWRGTITSSVTARTWLWSITWSVSTATRTCRGAIPSSSSTARTWAWRFRCGCCQRRAKTFLTQLTSWLNKSYEKTSSLTTWHLHYCKKIGTLKSHSHNGAMVLRGINWMVIYLPKNLTSKTAKDQFYKTDFAVTQLMARFWRIIWRGVKRVQPSTYLQLLYR